jgi:hypothetical protein
LSLSRVQSGWVAEKLSRGDSVRRGSLDRIHSGPAGGGFAGRYHKSTALRLKST